MIQGRQLLEAIGQALGRGVAYRARTRASDDAEQRRQRIVHGGAIDKRGRVAWIEERRLVHEGDHVEVTLEMRVASRGRLRSKGELDSYNPYFGCTLYDMAWTSDERVVALYHEKHNALVAQWTTKGSLRVAVAGSFPPHAIGERLVVYGLGDSDLMRVLQLPSLRSSVPIPTNAVALGGGSFAIERDASGPRLTGVDGAGRPLLVRLPSKAQRGVLRDMAAFVEGARGELARRAPAAASTAIDVLLGSTLGPFVADPCAARSSSRARPYGDPAVWFPAHRHRWLRARGRDAEADELLSSLDELGRGFDPATFGAGWYPSWTLARGAVLLAVELAERRARLLAEVCRTGVLPIDERFPGEERRETCSLWTWPGADAYVRMAPPSIPMAFIDALREVAADPPPPFPG